MRKYIILGAQVLVVLLLVGASALLANRWRLEGSNYSATKKADGEIERNSTVAEAENNATFILNEASAKADKDRGIILAEAHATAKKIEAEADTFRVKMNNESTEAQAEAIRAITASAAQKGNNTSSKNLFPEPTHFPDAFERPKPAAGKRRSILDKY